MILKLNLTVLKIIFLTAFALLAFFLLFTSRSAFAQEASPSPAADVANPLETLQYPVNELGGCADIGTCIEYCQDPVNNTKCVEFAKQKGIYKDDAQAAATDEFWQSTKNELGCDSRDSCLDYCAQEANFEKCDAFAKRNNIGGGGYVDQPDKPEYLEIAKEVLGCDSLSSCATVCDDSANSQKCTEFADQVGLLGGTTNQGPSGCQTSQTCQSYCSDPANFSLCQQHAPQDSNFTGPGGCDSEQTCFTYCEQNPDDCRSYAPGANGAYVPITCPENQTFGPGGECTQVDKIPEAGQCITQDKYWDGQVCQDQAPEGIAADVPSAHFETRENMGNCETPGECYDWCKDNQGQCEGFDASGPRPTDDYTPYVYYTPGTEVKFEPKADYGGCDSPGSCYDWCKGNEGKCQGFDAQAPRPLDVYVPGTYYTPPSDIAYVTPPVTSFYTTPVYFTPPAGSNYTTPQYYTPGSYYTPSYYTPIAGSNYVTPTYYTPGSSYYTPSGEYPTPQYTTPNYYTPPSISGYPTPYYYTPPSYMTPYYYTPTGNYNTPTYNTPPTYTTPTYYTPYGGGNYTTPVYYTPPTYYTPSYYTPPPGSPYTSPPYYTPPAPYTSPSYYTPGIYPTPPIYNTPPPYTTPSYYTPYGDYTTPTYYTPAPYSTPSYYTPPPYSTPYYYTPYSTPTYYTPSGDYTTPTYYTPGGYSTPYYPTPSYYTPGGGYTTPAYNTPSYYTPDGYSYPSPSYYTPGGTYSYPSPTYYTPGYSYPSPSYGTPSYGTPSYGTPTYETPSYGTPSYGTPSYETPSYSTPPLGAKTQRSFFQAVWEFLFNR